MNNKKPPIQIKKESIYFTPCPTVTEVVWLFGEAPEGMEDENLDVLVFVD